MDNTKTVAVKFFAEQDRLRGGPFDEVCAPAYSACLAGYPPMDLAGHKEFAATFYEAFPDLRHRVEEVIADGNRLAVRFRLTGTNTAPLMGARATGKPIDVGALALMTVENGKVSALTAEFDQLGMMQQIGAIPSK